LRILLSASEAYSFFPLRTPLPIDVGDVSTRFL
jgi:hypothetical protein